MRWVLVAIDDANGDCEHVCVRDQEDRLVDIRGFHPAGAMPVENGVALRDVDEAYVGGLTTLNWSPPDARGAEPWVDGVLALEASPVEDGAPT